MKRTVFIVSDGTGITAAALAHSLLTQFSAVQFQEKMLPYIDSEKKARAVSRQINKALQEDGIKPLVFSTLVDPKIRNIIGTSHGMVLDFFNTFIDPLELELQVKSSYSIGKTHGQREDERYNSRMEAIDFTLKTDDGLSINEYKKADVILLGVSRAAKTPTCLYLAMQFGIFAANYPITEEDLTAGNLPKFLLPYRKKSHGLTIDPERLHHIRTNRKPGSRYASLLQCQKEVHTVEALFEKWQIPYINSTTRSIEEIATTIISTLKLQRRLF